MAKKQEQVMQVVADINPETVTYVSVVCVSEEKPVLHVREDDGRIVLRSLAFDEVATVVNDDGLKNLLKAGEDRRLHFVIKKGD